MADGSFMDLDVDVVELAPYVPPVEVRALGEMAFKSTAYTPAEIETLKTMFAAGELVEVIARTLGRGSAGVATKLAELGLRRNCIRPWSEFEDAELVKRYGQVSAAVLAQELGRGCSAVYIRAQVLGISEVGAPPYSAWEDAQIRAGYSVGVPATQVAALIGRPLSGVVSRASTLGVRHASHPDDWSDEELARALELAETGAKYLAIIEQLVAEGFPRRTKAGFGPKIRRLGYGRGWGRNWTPDEDALLTKAYKAGDNLRHLAARVGRSHHSLKWRAEALSLTGTHPNRDGWRGGPEWTPADDETLRSLYGVVKPAEIARRMDRTKAAIFTRAWNLDLSAGYWRHFTAEDDLAIRIGARHGLNASQLGRTLGRVSRCVSDRATEFLGVNLVKGKGGRVQPREYTLAEVLALEGYAPRIERAGRRRYIPPRLIIRLGQRRAWRQYRVAA